jgi:hypothetical protein
MISKKNAFIYFVRTISITTWGGDQMVKALKCDQGSEGSNFNLDICLGHHDDVSS